MLTHNFEQKKSLLIRSWGRERKMESERLKVEHRWQLKEENHTEREERKTSEVTCHYSLPRPCDCLLTFSRDGTWTKKREKQREKKKECLYDGWGVLLLRLEGVQLLQWWAAKYRQTSGLLSDGCLTGSGLVFTLQSQARNHSHVDMRADTDQTRDTSEDWPQLKHNNPFTLMPLGE